MAVTPEAFKQALQLWASGIAVVTSKTEEFGLRGMTVTAFSSVSAKPPQILVCLNQNADTGENIDQNGRFAVNILNTSQQDVSNNFSGGSSQEDRFANSRWSIGETGVPILDDSILSLECKVIEKIRAGSHWILIGEVEATVCRSGEPLLYFRSGYRQLTDV
ncbi:MAG: flavin reductase family protein [Methyloglobulus sp.]|nr:flavin reductase family protein [Methyloglobulus sp.]